MVSAAASTQHLDPEGGATHKSSAAGHGSLSVAEREGYLQPDLARPPSPVLTRPATTRKGRGRDKSRASCQAPSSIQAPRVAPADPLEARPFRGWKERQLTPSLNAAPFSKRDWKREWQAFGERMQCFCFPFFFCIFFFSPSFHLSSLSVLRHLNTART